MRSSLICPAPNGCFSTLPIKQNLPFRFHLLSQFAVHLQDWKEKENTQALRHKHKAKSCDVKRTNKEQFQVPHREDTASVYQPWLKYSSVVSGTASALPLLLSALKRERKKKGSLTKNSKQMAYKLPCTCHNHPNSRLPMKPTDTRRAQQALQSDAEAGRMSSSGLFNRAAEAFPSFQVSKQQKPKPSKYQPCSTSCEFQK